MFNKYFLVQLTCNMSDGISQSISAYDTEKIALDKFYDGLSKVGGNENTKYVKFILLNVDGVAIKTELVDNARFIPTPEPEVEPTEETEV